MRRWLPLLLLPALAGAGDLFPGAEPMTSGVFYYPEQWPRDQWQRDFERMAALGFRFTHMGEFAWAQLEPSPGHFDFRWLDEAVALAARAGLKVVLCTPTACPPAWLGDQHPELYRVGPEGRRREHGLRSDASLSDPVYRQRADRIVTALARHYGHDPRVIGWQVDNEPPAAEDYSPAARKAFQGWLRQRYGTVEALDRAWGGTFWSLAYGSFGQVRLPNDSLNGEDHLSPHARLDFKRFTADVQAAFLNHQADLLHRFGRDQWVTTNYTNISPDADPRRSDRLDFPSFTIYPVAGQNVLGGPTFRFGSPYRMAEACDFHRPLKGRTGVMELQPGQVNWAPVNPLPAPGAIALWIWHAFGGGASFVCTYRYRHPRFGSELYHDGIVGTDGVTLSQGGREFTETLAALRRLPLAPGAPPPPAVTARRTAFLWSQDVQWDLELHRESEHWDTWKHRDLYFSALKSTGAPVDFLAEEDAFGAYPFLVAPAYQLVDAALVARWTAYARAGGHLILTCRTGQKDKAGQLPEGRWAQALEDLAGVRFDGFDSLPDAVEGKVVSATGTHPWRTWGDLLAPGPGTEVLATYADAFYAGKAAATRHVLGKGSVTFIGVQTLDGRLERDLVRDVYRRAGVAIEDFPPGVFLEWRDGLAVGVNYSAAPATFPVPAGTVPLVGRNPLPPCQALVWKASP